MTKQNKTKPKKKGGRKNFRKKTIMPFQELASNGRLGCCKLY
jgi:hypothetical protein